MISFVFFFFLMIRRPPRSTPLYSSAASDVYKRQRCAACPPWCRRPCTRPAFILSLIHISEPTRRTPISYAVFCLKKKKNDIVCFFFFFNDTATTEIYTSLFVGSVRCV